MLESLGNDGVNVHAMKNKLQFSMSKISDYASSCLSNKIEFSAAGEEEIEDLKKEKATWAHAKEVMKEGTRFRT